MPTADILTKLMVKPYYTNTYLVKFHEVVIIGYLVMVNFYGI